MVKKKTRSKKKLPFGGKQAPLFVKGGGRAKKKVKKK